MIPLLREHDHERFQIFCYSDVIASDDLTDRLRALADHWRDLVGVSDEKAEEIIRSDQIDILIDLTAHMARNRLLLFARKPAPVQATYLGYCSTTGLEAMDYRLSDPFLDSPESATGCYRERTIRLARSYWCYEPCEKAPDVSASPAASNGFVTFGCLNNIVKVSPGALQIWAEILRRSPGSRLMLAAPRGVERKGLLERMQQWGLAPDQLELIDRRCWQRYMESYWSIDIGLDPFPYGGGITTLDALWMGVPVVSLSGETAVGRAGRSILSNIGLPGLVAETHGQYIEAASLLASDMARLKELRSTLRERMERSPLRDAKGHARDIEAAYCEMWRRWTADQNRK
jgi:predicted O-linked N-acetylglucosamine transferase (SPINDLY family)